jgi:flavin reductase (DIM6/NTAB) family NADH-FMN oxidoreductase RutF
MTSTQAIDPSRFRQVLGHLPTGVAVVTTVHEGQPVGLAVGSFCSVSLDPPLVVFFVATTSSTLPHIQDAGLFCANVLGDDQEEICRAFASKGADRFGHLGWQPGVTGAPVLDDALAFVECRIERIDPAGDHKAVYGRVLDMGVRAEAGAGPLLFFRGGYGRLATALNPEEI